MDQLVEQSLRIAGTRFQPTSFVKKNATLPFFLKICKCIKHFFSFQALQKKEKKDEKGENTVSHLPPGGRVPR